MSKARRERREFQRKRGEKLRILQSAVGGMRAAHPGEELQVIFDTTLNKTIITLKKNVPELPDGISFVAVDDNGRIHNIGKDEFFELARKQKGENR